MGQLKQWPKTCDEWFTLLTASLRSQRSPHWDRCCPLALWIALFRLLVEHSQTFVSLLGVLRQSGKLFALLQLQWDYSVLVAWVVVEFQPLLWRVVVIVLDTFLVAFNIGGSITDSIWISRAANITLIGNAAYRTVKIVFAFWGCVITIEAIAL